MSSKNDLKPIPDLTTESAADLLGRDLPPVKMVVGNMIPAGKARLIEYDAGARSVRLLPPGVVAAEDLDGMT